MPRGLVVAGRDYPAAARNGPPFPPLQNTGPSFIYIIVSYVILDPIVIPRASPAISGRGSRPKTPPTDRVRESAWERTTERG